jgi:CelD/BcsL family acetyltransferase involved in cellulose biosynthesis
VTSIDVSGGGGFAALGARWRCLEQRAGNSFFQSWTWMGCLAEERFSDSVLVEATEHGETVALALFNRRRRLGGGTLWLGESGDAVMDRPYIECNGVLTLADQEPRLTAACLGAARAAWPAAHDLRLSGIDDMTLDAARRASGGVWVERSLPAPFADLESARLPGGDYLAGRSANTRQQLRRSARAFEVAGPLAVKRAETAADAHAALDALAPLHQATWLARGEPGCFSEPFFGRFHHALIDRGMPRGEVDLLRVTAGERIVGILYNFRYRGGMLAYQSGFDYAGVNGPRKPGLTCHHEAIRFALTEGLGRYEFLAGDDRYKRSLSDGGSTLHWVRAGAAWSPWLLRRRVAAWVRGGGSPAAGVRTSVGKPYNVSLASMAMEVKALKSS